MNYSHETNSEQVRNTFGTTQRTGKSEKDVKVFGIPAQIHFFDCLIRASAFASALSFSTSAFA